jgi:peptidoglycan/LPS O-acetylase OafA/YrhL
MNRLVISARNSRGAFRPDIEGLRGIAVILVVLFHTGVPGFRGGYVGVDVFFVVSGYLITSLIVMEIEKTDAFSVRNFYARRVRRLLPASGLAIVGVVLAGFVLYSPLELSRYAIWGAFTSLYIGNFMFMRDAVNYFAGPATHNPFLHTWSLAVEEQFYLLWPALIALISWRSLSRRRLAGWLFAVTVLSLAASIWVTAVRQPWAFLSLPTRAWEFGVGGLGCLLPTDVLSPSRGWLKLLSWMGFTSLLAAGHYYGSVRPMFPGYVALVPVLGTLAMLLEGAPAAPSILQSMLAWPGLQWMGRLSYSWYLWHWPFLIYAKACLPELSWRGRLLVALAALFLAQLTYWFLENPVRHNSFLIARPSLSLGLAVLIPAVGVSIALAASHAASVSLSTAQQHQIEVATIVGTWHDCIVPENASATTECIFGDHGSQTQIVLFGDSHAGQWFPAVNSIAEQKHWKLVTLLKANCQVAAREINPQGRATNASCEMWEVKAFERISVLRPSMVVLGESARAVGDPRMSQWPVTPREWEDGLRVALNKLDAMGTKTLVIADIPYASFEVPVCLSRAASAKWGPKSCEINSEAGLNQQVRDGERAAVDSNSGARWVDFSGLFCRGSRCATIIDNLVAYRDDNHISEILARHLTPQLLHEMDLLIDPPNSKASVLSMNHPDRAR